MANITLHTALAAQLTPAVCRFTCPPTFNPSNDYPVTFLNKNKKCAILNSWTYSLKISYLEHF